MNFISYQVTSSFINCNGIYSSVSGRGNWLENGPRAAFITEKLKIKNSLCIINIGHKITIKINNF
jgi:hypothetical protein